jgi:hypothetical protein
MNETDLNREFDKIISETISPILKGLGFKRKTSNFYRETEELVQTFNILKSPWNNKNDISFTGNIGFIEPETYKKLYETEELPKFPKCTDSLIQIRLGLLTHGTDHWYRLSSNTDFVGLRNQLGVDLLKLVQLFENKRTVISLEEFFQDRAKVNPFWGEIAQYAYNKKIGKDKLARQLLEKAYENAKIPQSWLTEKQQVNGIWIERKSNPTINTSWINRIERVFEIYKEKIKNAT